MPLPTKLAIFVTFHFAETRLPYLRTICQEFVNLGHSVKAYLFTNDAQQHATIAAAIQCPELAIEILSPTLLGHPYLLTWCHLATARELFNADPTISHFLYLEDDIRITQANMIWWMQARKKLQKYNLYPGLMRYEVHPKTKQLYSSDVITPAIYEDISKLVLKDGSYAFLNLNYPYQGLALMDRELMEEYLQMPDAQIDKTNWGIREKANQGLTFWNVPSGFQSRPMVGYDVKNQCIDPRCLVHHLPNSYVAKPKEPLGKVALAGIIKLRTIKEHRLARKNKTIATSENCAKQPDDADSKF